MTTNDLNSDRRVSKLCGFALLPCVISLLCVPTYAQTAAPGQQATAGQITDDKPVMTTPGQSPVEKAWTILQSGLEGKGDNKVEAVHALGVLSGNPKAIDQAKAALQDTNPDVRTAAAEALGHMKAKSTASLLVEDIKNEKDIQVALAEANALVDMGDSRGYNLYYEVLTGAQKNGSIIDDQKKMLHDPKKMAELGLVSGIGFVPFGGLGLGAFRVLTKDDAGIARAGAARMLAKDPDPKSESALIDAVFDKSWIVRAAALNALAQRGNARVVPKIEPAMDDEKNVVRYTAAAVVIHLSGARTKTASSSTKSK